MSRPFTFFGEMKHLEVARGHDGLLRGDPEPVVVVVCWTLHGHEGGQESRFRLPFLSEDRRNDWTAIVNITR